MSDRDGERMRLSDWVCMAQAGLVAVCVFVVGFCVLREAWLLFK